MHVLIFEVYPTADGRQEYLDIAAELREELAKIDGFISVERFQSLTDPDKMLSISTWRDEAAIKTWRDNMEHGKAQDAGRNRLFSKYRIRVAEVVRDYEKENSPWN